MTIMPDQWFPADSGEIERVPAWLRPWLLEPGSLTQRLKACCVGEFGLVVLDERPVPMTAADADALGLSPGAAALSREVHLCCDGVPRIHARSLLPESTLTGPAASLAALGTRPLGDALFTFPDLKRGTIEIAHTDDGWARRSVFRIGDAPLLVAEWFLPTLERCAA
jgi:chorismate lyase